MQALSKGVRVPDGARPASRLLTLDPGNRVLYLHARETGSGRRFWVMPGGGLEPGESFESAALREAREETGLEVELHACLWTRHHVYEWEGREHNQFEVFFLARTDRVDVRPRHPDSYVFGHRWWSQDELRRSGDQFAPTRIARLLTPVLKGDIPPLPIDCGV
ncbi:MAG: NUDIX domain-containing protein [Pseudomonadales bacterium]